MTNAELIKVLRCGTSKQEEKPDCRWCYYFHSGECCWTIIMADAADALEAADKKIEELEAQMPKEGEWIVVDDITSYCSVCKWASYSMLIRKDAFLLRNNKTKYCPNCGARMKGENDEES